MDAAVTVEKSLFFIAMKFDPMVAQTRLMRWFPSWLCIDYTRMMMAALVLGPWPRSIGLIGLGGGAQAHFCYRYLRPAKIRVVENNLAVIRLRKVCRLPDDNARFGIDWDDGARWIGQQPGAFDLLLVDAYTSDGLADQVTSSAFYRACRAALRPSGRVSFNFFACPLAPHVARIRDVFSQQVLLLPQTSHGNCVVIASRCRLPQTLSTHACLHWTARWQLRTACRTLQHALSGHWAKQKGLLGETIDSSV